MATGGFEVIRGGEGFSTRTPQKGDTITKIIKRRGGGSSSPAPTYKSVKIDGNTVFINGQGFSVEPSKQALFIRQQTGGSGSSAQSAIKQAQLIQEQQLKILSDKRQEETRKLREQVKQQKEQKAFGQTVAGQINIKDRKGTGSFGTMQNYNVPKTTPDVNIYTQPTIEERVTGSFKDTKTGRDIPLSNYFLIEPPKSGVGLTTEKVIYPSGTTPSGSVFSIPGYEDVTVEKELQASTEKRTLKKKVTSSVGGAFEKANTNVKKAYTDPFASLIVEKTKGTAIGGETGLTLEKAKLNIRESTEFLKSNVGKSSEFLISKGVSPKIVKTGEFISGAGIGGGEFISGAGIGIVEDVRYKPAKQVAILAATAGVGYGLSATTAGVTSASTKIFGRTAGLYTGVGLKTAQIGAGVVLGGAFAVKTGGAVVSQAREGDYLGAGSTLGVATKDIAIGAYGFKSGQKLFTKTKGLWATRGREEIIIKQGDYPQAPTSKQLEMFKKNVIKELGDKPGAFHTTSEVFWKDGKIIPVTSTSELPGVYGSTQISTPFARISGSGDKGNILTSLKNWKTWFKVQGKPGVAYLQPEKFRYSPAVKQPNIIEGTKFSYKFVNPPKPGVADVPLIKSEIEAIFRPGAGEYGFTSGSYYTKIKGVRVPIDVFGYAGTTGTTGATVLTPTTTYSSLVSQGYYSGVTSYSLSPSFGVIGSILSSTRSSRVTPSSSASLISSYRSPSYSTSYAKPAGYSSYIFGGSSRAFGGSSKTSEGSSSSPSYTPYGSSSYKPLSPSVLIPARPGGLLPKFPKYKEKSRKEVQLYKQPTAYQTSLTGSILGIRGTGVAPGGLSIRGILDSKTTKKKKKKKSIYNLL